MYKGEFRGCYALWENYRMEAKVSWGVPPAVRNGAPFAILWGKQLEWGYLFSYLWAVGLFL